MLAMHPAWNWLLAVVAGCLLPLVIAAVCLVLVEGTNRFLLACRLDCLIRYRVYNGLLYGGYSLLLAVALFGRYRFWPMTGAQLAVFLTLLAIMILVIIGICSLVSSWGSAITSFQRFIDEDDYQQDARELA